ncbi:MAG: PepSY domain-containing protein [Gammaproteobacteria bacterium]
MKKPLMIAGAICLAVVSITGFAHTVHQLLPLTMEQARARALQVTPGTIRHAELVKMIGRSNLCYSVDIQTVMGLRKIYVDAVTGEILSIYREVRKAGVQNHRSS